jgi:hypothetical protein
VPVLGAVGVWKTGWVCEGGGKGGGGGMPKGAGVAGGVAAGVEKGWGTVLLIVGVGAGAARPRLRAMVQRMLVSSCGGGVAVGVAMM